MSRKFPYENIPCAAEINAAFHRVESIINAAANCEDIDYVQDSFMGAGKRKSNPHFIPPGGSLPDLWGNIYNMTDYKGKERYYDSVGTIDKQGIIAIDGKNMSPSVIVSIARIWSV